MSQDTKGWIGVDLDGTLARSGGLYDGEIGEPIPAMVDRVRVWLSEGKDVRLFTARANGIRIKEAIAIDQWCLDNIGHALPLTYEKDKYMTELWDDRAIQVVKNTGQRADGEL